MQRAATSCVRATAAGSSSNNRSNAIDVFSACSSLGFKQPSGIRQLHLVAKRGEHVLERPPRLLVVEHLVSGDDRDRELRDAVPQAQLLPRLFRTAVACRHRVDAVAERFLQPVPDEERVGLLGEQAALPSHSAMRSGACS